MPSDEPVVSGVPEELAAYTEETVPALGPVRALVTELRSAIARADGEPSEVAITLEDRSAQVTELVEVLEVLDREPAAVGWALEAADRGSWVALMLGPAGRYVDPPAPRRARARDDDAFTDLVTEAIRAHATQPGRDGLTSTAWLGLSVTAVSELARRSPSSLDQLVDRITLEASRPKPRVWRTVKSVADPVGLALAGIDGWQRSAEDPLATRGERIAGAGYATALEGGGAFFGGVLGGAAGAPAGPPGILLGAGVGGLAGGLGGGVVRDASIVQRSEELVAGFIDGLAGTSREPDRYDELVESP